MSDPIRDVAREMREGAENVLETAVNEHVRMSAHAVLSWATRLEQALANQQSATAGVPDDGHCRKAIQDYLDGNYPHPRTFRRDPVMRGKCKHGQYYYEECGQCIDEHFEAALNASPAAPSGWQPIESAPKDGTFVLLLDHGVIDCAFWSMRSKQWEIGYRCAGEGKFTIDNPTHWMPLPAPPAVQSRAEIRKPLIEVRLPNGELVMTRDYEISE